MPGHWNGDAYDRVISFFNFLKGLLNVESPTSPWGSIATYQNGEKVWEQTLSVAELITHVTQHHLTSSTTTTESASVERPQGFTTLRFPEHFSVVITRGLGNQELESLTELLGMPHELRQDLKLPSTRPRIDIFDRFVLTAARTFEADGKLDHGSVPRLKCVLGPDLLLIIDEDNTSTVNKTAIAGVTPKTVAYGTIDAYLRFMSLVAQNYAELIEVLDQRIAEIELEVFSGDSLAPTHIYQLGRDVLALEQGVSPLAQAFDDWEDEVQDMDVPSSLKLGATHVQRKLTRVTERAQGLRTSLAEIMDVNSALIGQRQNEDMKKISSWAAIIVVPTLVSGIYGMNFNHMPELHWALGYPFALSVMVAASVALYAVFKRKKWL